MWQAQCNLSSFNWSLVSSSGKVHNLICAGYFYFRSETSLHIQNVGQCFRCWCLEISKPQNNRSALLERKDFRGNYKRLTNVDPNIEEEYSSVVGCSLIHSKWHTPTPASISIWLPPESHALSLCSLLCPLMRPYRGHHINTKQPPSPDTHTQMCMPTHTHTHRRVHKHTHTALICRTQHPRWPRHEASARRKKKNKPREEILSETSAVNSEMFSSEFFWNSYTPLIWSK